MVNRATAPSWDSNSQCFVCGKYLADHPVSQPKPKPKAKAKAKGKRGGEAKEPHTKEERPNERSVRLHEQKNLEQEEELAYGQEEELANGQQEGQEEELANGLRQLCQIPSASPNLFCDPSKLRYSWHRSRNEMYRKLAEINHADYQRACQDAQERLRIKKWNQAKRHEERELRHEQWLLQQPYGAYQ